MTAVTSLDIHSLYSGNPLSITYNAPLIPLGDQHYLVFYYHSGLAVELRHIEIVDDTIVLGPACAVGGTDSAPTALYAATGEGWIVVSGFRALWAVMDVGSTTVAPTVGPPTFGLGIGDTPRQNSFIARTAGGLFLYGYDEVTGVCRRSINETTGAIEGGTGNLGWPAAGFTPPSGYHAGHLLDPGGGGQRLASWYNISTQRRRAGPVSADYANDTLSFGPLGSHIFGFGDFSSAVHQGAAPWTLFGGLSFMDDDGNPYSEWAVEFPFGIGLSAIGPWHDNLLLGILYQVGALTFRLITVNPDFTATADSTLRTVSIPSTTSSITAARVDDERTLFSYGKNLILVGAAPKCAGTLANKTLFSDTIPPATLRPRVVLFPAGPTVNTEWVVAYCPRLNPTTGGYVVELRYASAAGETVTLGPPSFVGGGSGFGGLDGSPGLIGLWDNGHKILALHAFSSCVITDPGDLDTPPTAGPVQSAGLTASSVLADCDDGLFILEWVVNGPLETPPNTVMVYRRAVLGATIGARDAGTALGYHFPGTPTAGTWTTSRPMGPFDWPKIVSWVDDASRTWFASVDVDRADALPIFSTPAIPKTGVGQINSHTHQGDRPPGSSWVLRPFNGTAVFLGTDGTVVATSPSSTPIELMHWHDNDFLGFSGGSFTVQRMNSDGSISVVGTSCSSTPQEYSVTQDHSYGRIGDKRTLIGVGKRLLLAGEVVCTACVPDTPSGWSINRYLI